MKTEKLNVAIIGSRTFDDYGLLCCMSNNQAYIWRVMYRTFDKVRERGNIGIPCFVKEDGSVIISLKHYDSSLAEADIVEGAACNLDGTDC